MASDVSQNDSNAMDICPEFAFFRKLPKEIRDEIWSYCFTFIPPRTIELVSATSVFSVDGEEDIELNYRVGAKPAPVPLIFQVCVESRERAMKEFPRALGSLIDNGPIFFDFSKDTLLFDSLATFQNLFRKRRCFLRALVEIEEDVNKALCHLEQNLKLMAIKDCITSHSRRDFERFCSLERLTFLDDSYRYWPLRPDFKARLLPMTLSTPWLREQFVKVHEYRLRMEWSSFRQRNRRNHESELTKIEYKDLHDMVSSMG